MELQSVESVAIRLLLAVHLARGRLGGDLRRHVRADDGPLAPTRVGADAHDPRLRCGDGEDGPAWGSRPAGLLEDVAL